MKNFARFLARVGIVFGSAVLLLGFPITLLNKIGIVGALPTLLLCLLAYFVSKKLLSLFNNKMQEIDSKKI